MQALLSVGKITRNRFAATERMAVTVLKERLEGEGNREHRNFLKSKIKLLEPSTPDSNMTGKAHSLRSVGKSILKMCNIPKLKQTANKTLLKAYSKLIH